MYAVFVELPPFEKHREQYLDDDAFLVLQEYLLLNPLAEDVIQGTDGLRKIRHRDLRRGKGKRGGLRVIFYYWDGGPENWLFTVYDKNVADDLSGRQRDMLHDLLKRKLRARRQ